MALAVVVCVGMSGGGCNIIGPIVGVAQGRGTVEARYKLVEKPTLIYVDDRMSKLNRASLRHVISRTAGDILLKRELVEEVIDPRAAMALARQEQPDDPLTIEDLAIAVGAEQVVYVEIDQFGLSADGTTIQPTAYAWVKVIEVGATPARRWPEMDGGYSLVVQLRQSGMASEIDTARRRDLQDTLAEEIGRRLAGLFFKSERPYLLEGTL
ncbi:MAG: hypothetical protein KAS72_00440 [Phycisphaerales bacterium]|nr:hypothetical protein [Phycisphaerales bacterium]